MAPDRRVRMRRTERRMSKKRKISDSASPSTIPEGILAGTGTGIESAVSNLPSISDYAPNIQMLSLDQGTSVPTASPESQRILLSISETLEAAPKPDEVLPQLTANPSRDVFQSAYDSLPDYRASTIEGMAPNDNVHLLQSELALTEDGYYIMDDNVLDPALFQETRPLSNGTDLEGGTHH